MTLVTEATQFGGGGGTQGRLAHKEHTPWQNNNNYYNNNIIHPGQTQLPQANCKIQKSSSVSVGSGRGCLPACTPRPYSYQLPEEEPALLPTPC